GGFERVIDLLLELFGSHCFHIISQSVGLDLGGHDDLLTVLEERRKRYEDVCKNAEIPGTVSFSLAYLPANLSVCVPPKVGCTFWKRVIYFLHGDTDRGPDNDVLPVSSPFDVSRMHVHFVGAWENKTLDFHDAHERALLFSTTRVLFSRDPWSRLWSGFVDKFVLPDSWLDHGLAILRMRLRMHSKDPKKRSLLESLILKSGGHDSFINMTRKKNFQCADDVTFAEFLYYALVVNPNAHWSPVHEVCSPCVLKPQVLGKMETFSQDASYVLGTSGLGHFLQNYSHAGHVTNELQTILDYHMHLWPRRQDKLHNCLDILGMGRRLWLAFQYNGYIPLTTSFPEQVLKTELINVTIVEARDRVLGHVNAAASKERLSESEWVDLRRRIMVSAYRAVPRELLELVQKRFKWDFELFDYDPEPVDIFHH
ncbi:hypothetical protein BaRGS_00034176, partial [Batillaria attramentaria]